MWKAFHACGRRLAKIWGEVQLAPLATSSRAPLLAAAYQLQAASHLASEISYVCYSCVWFVKGNLVDMLDCKLKYEIAYFLVKTCNIIKAASAPQDWNIATMMLFFFFKGWEEGDHEAS